MHNELLYLISFAVAFFASFAITPICRLI
jgi:hypothetical protein